MADDFAYMEMIYIAKDGHARKTGIGAAMDTDVETVSAFHSYRGLEVPKMRARFLLDLHDATGDLIDTILLDRAGFEHISNERAKTAAEYDKIDRDYWDDARRRYKQEKFAPHA